MKLKSFSQILKESIKKNKSQLCVGLDIDPDRISLKSNYSINSLKNITKKLIDQTIENVVAYKLNLAFFEVFGSKGYKWLEETIKYIDGKKLLIGDGKRGDIGNTTNKYANSLFDHFGFDAITVSPYMGQDSILPFIKYKNKGIFVLCLTSNPSARDIQLKDASGLSVFRRVISMVRDIDDNKNLGLVIGATKPEQIADIRLEAGDLPFLIPWIGAQGGNLEESLLAGNNENGLAIINVSRSIIYSKDPSFSSRDYNEKINRIIS